MKKLKWKYAGIVVSVWVLGLGVLLSSRLPNTPFFNSDGHSGPFSPTRALTPFRFIFSALSNLNLELQQPEEEKVETPSEPPSITLTPELQFPPQETLLKAISLLESELQNKLLVFAATVTESIPDELEKRRIRQQLLLVSRDRARLPSFLAQLPSSVQLAAKDYLKVAFEIQDQYLTLDGITRDYLKPHEVVAPKKLNEHAELVRSTEINLNTQNHIREVSEAEKLNEADLQKLLQLCDKERPCVERGVLAWIDAHHFLTEAQINLIDQSVVDPGE